MKRTKLNVKGNVTYKVTDIRDMTPEQWDDLIEECKRYNEALCRKYGLPIEQLTTAIAREKLALEHKVMEGLKDKKDRIR